VRELGLPLPRTEEDTTYGSPALKVGGTVFACLAINRSAGPGSLVVPVSTEQRDELIAADPSV